jgi:hypothetical protein
MAKEKKEQPLSVDDQFLKDHLDRGGKAVEIESGKEIDKGNVDALLEEVASQGPARTPKQEGLHKEAKSIGAADTTREDAAKAIKEQQRIEHLRQQDLKKRQSKALNVASRVSTTVQDSITDPFIDRAGGFIDRVSNASTVGGVGTLLAILIFLLFVVIVVNPQGDTRIKQFWYMLNGRASLIGRQTIGQGGQPSSSGVPGAVNPNGTVNGPDGKPITLQSIGAADTKAIQNPQGPAVQWVEGVASQIASEYRTLFG